MKLFDYLNNKLHSADPSAPVGTSYNPSRKICTLSNFITLSRIALVIVFFILLLLGVNRLVCFLLFGIASITDFLDGYIARKTQTVSWFGKILDPLVDRLLIFSGVVGLWIVGDVPLWILILLIARDLLLGIGMLIVRKYRARPIDVLYLGKIATALIFIGFTWILLDVPVISGFGWIDVTWLPLLNTQSACVGFLPLYAGIICSVITFIAYALEAILVYRDARHA